MKSEYRSNKTVAANHTVPLPADDPTLTWDEIAKTKQRIGAPIEIIGLDGKSLIQGGINVNNAYGTKTSTLSEDSITSYLTPPIFNQPPKVYPGGSGPFIILPTDPTDVSVVWSGEDLVITFNWDPANPYNVTVTQFIVELTSDGITKRTPMNAFGINKTQTAQSVTVTKSMIASMFNVFVMNISSVCVLVADPLANISNTICATTVPAYVLTLPVPVINVTAINNGYSVSYTTPTEGVYDAIEIVEYESTSSTEPTGVTYVRTYFGTINPAVVVVSNFNARWVKARFSSDGGKYTEYSAAQKVTPTSPISVDLTPPNEVTSVTASWSGDNVVINYSQPTLDSGTRYLAVLTAPNSSVGYFYFYPTGATPLSQTATITKNDIFNQFGKYYSTFSGVLKSIDASDNRSSGVSFTTGTRANPLASITPTFTAVAISNGYTVSFPFPTEAEYGEIYQKYTSWSGTTSYFDSFTGTRSAGGLSGTNTLTLSSVTDNHGTTLTTLPVGYRVTGTGIPDNTYITSVTGTQMTVNNNFTSNVTGVVTGYALVYGGIGPATISSTIYANTYLVMKFYDAFGNESLVSLEQIVVPINPAVVDNTVPSAPTVNTVSTTNTTASITIATTDVTTKGYKLRYKKNTDTLYTTVEIAPLASFVSGTSTTSYTIGNLDPATLYDISASGYNQYNGLGSYSANSAATTATPTVALPTSLTTKLISYGIIASWVAASNTPTKISRYKVELYNAANTKLLTDYTTSLTYDFIGLTVGTAYYVKVYSEDIYGLTSEAVNSSPNLTVVAMSTDGLAPLASPTPTVNALYGALEVKWTGLTVGSRTTSSNPDPVIYEVHLSSTNGFTPSSGTKAMETSGTLAVLRTLPGTSTALVYGTAYYVKLIAKDADGSAEAGTQASSAPTQIVTTDVGSGQITSTQIASNTITASNIAANTISAGQIAAGTITATQIATDTITANQIAANAISSSEISASAIQAKSFILGGASGTYNIVLDGNGNGTTTPYKLYSGTGTWKGNTTPFYLDSVGQFSLLNKLSFDPSTSTLAVDGTITAQSGNFAGAMTVNNGTMKIGTAAGGTGNHGIYIGEGNYWYSSGNLAVGNALTWNGTALNVNGSINTNALSITGPTLIGGSGYLMVATSYSITNVSGNGTTITYTANNSLSTGQTVTIVGINPSVYNLTNATVASASGTQFTVTNSAQGTYISGGTVMVTGGTTAAARIQIASTALTAYDANGNATTQIVSNATNGANTFITTRAKIADWTITDTKIESILVSGITKYTGLSASNTSYAFWAGATTSSNTDNTAPFSVTPTGAVVAKNISIIGSGTITGVTATGTGSVMTYTTASAHNLSVGQSVTVSGMSIAGYNVTGTITTTPSTTTFTLAGAGSGSATGGIVAINIIRSSNFSVDSTGVMTASGANVTGTINASLGSFTGGIQIGSSGSLYSGTLSGGNLSGLGFILNQNGLLFQNAGGSAITQITASNGQLITTSANIGGWTVDSSKIFKTSAGGQGNLSLDSANGYIYVSSDNVSTYTAGINSASTASSVAFWAGSAVKAGNLPDPSLQTTVSTTATGTSGTRTITVASAIGIAIGQRVSGTGIGSSAIVTSISGTTITLSATNTTTVSGTITFSTYTNRFIVRMDGTLFASGAQITGGTVSSSGALGSIVLDGDKSLISLSTASKTSYLIPRNGNLYITAPGTALPWGTSDGSGGVNTTAPTAEPYFVAGSNFKDPWNNTTSGIGMYTGNWDYFTNGVSDPFVTVSKNGTIQLSASPDIGLIVEKGGATGDAFTVPTIMMYTSKAGTAPYKPSTAYGSWATFQKGHINLSASAETFMSIFGDYLNVSAGAWPAWTNTYTDLSTNITGYQAVSNSLFIRSGKLTNTTGDQSAYAGPSQIVVNGSKVSITGIPRATTFDMEDYRVGTAGAGNYRNLSALGYPPRQRMVIEDPKTGEAQLGLGVYYLDLTKINGTGPGASMGVQGDIALVF